ncbi:MAG: guanylate kinase, partial [Oscillospiraceae bacterium]|nr:guanylate kinase [Oscillospiraceae bacterium]
MKDKGILIVVSAPSGCGKGTILAEVLKDEKFFYSVSATTRSPRPGETD